MYDTCLENVHFKCEGIKSLSDIKSKFFTCDVCQDRPLPNIDLHFLLTDLTHN